MSGRQTIAAIVIARDEEANLADCLAGLAFCDQIVVVDGGSLDATVELARKAGALVSVRPDWQGFGVQKQRALDLATTDWVLSIDADERVSEALGAEIRQSIERTDVTGFRINRKSTFLGQTMRHGGWFPDRILRLARRQHCRFDERKIHETLIVDGRVADLNSLLLHYSYTSIDDLLKKMRLYASLSAEERRNESRYGGLLSAIVRSKFTFFKVYIVQGGFLDGSRGFVAALYRAQETFWRYLAVGWEKSR